MLFNPVTVCFFVFFLSYDLGDIISPDEKLSLNLARWDGRGHECAEVLQAVCVYLCLP